MKVKAYLVTLFIYIFLLPTSIGGFPIAFLVWISTIFFDKKRRIFHRFTSYWAQLYILVNPWWNVKITDRKKLNDKKTYIMISNHQSMLDILVLFSLNAHFKWVSKTEVFRIPVVGWMMYMNKYIQLKRGSLKSVALMMKKCKEALNTGSSLMFFPEGTRSTDGNMGRFKEGAFKLAKDNKVDILPIIINGAAEALPKKGIIMRKKQTITINILDELLYEDFKDTPIQDLIKSTHSIMANELQKIREKQ